jgi:hypothetical protein
MRVESKQGRSLNFYRSEPTSFVFAPISHADNVMGVDLVQQRDRGGDGNDNRKYREVKRSHSRGS